MTFKARQKMAVVRRGPDYFDKTLFVSKDAETRYENLMDYSKLLDSYSINPTELEALGYEHATRLFEIQKSMKLLLNTEPAYKDEVCQFYGNLVEGVGGTWTTRVNGTNFEINWWKINEVLGCPYATDTELAPAVPGGPINMHFAGGLPAPEQTPVIDRLALAHRYFGRPLKDNASADAYNLKYLSIDERIVYEMVHRSLVPTGGNIAEPNTTTAMSFLYVMSEKPFNPGYLILKHMLNVIAGSKPTHNIPYGSFITMYLKKQNASFQFQSDPTPVLYFDSNYWSTKKWILVDGKWMHKPPAVKNKRARFAQGKIIYSYV